MSFSPFWTSHAHRCPDQIHLYSHKNFEKCFIDFCIFKRTHMWHKFHIINSSKYNNLKCKTQTFQLTNLLLYTGCSNFEMPVIWLVLKCLISKIQYPRFIQFFKFLKLVRKWRLNHLTDDRENWRVCKTSKYFSVQNRKDWTRKVSLEWNKKYFKLISTLISDCLDRSWYFEHTKVVKLR